MSDLRCRTCGTPDVATFRKADGKTYRRSFCKTCWNVYQQSLRNKLEAQVSQDLSPGWEFVHAGRQRPPRGVLRAVIYLTTPGGKGRHNEGITANRVVIYAGDTRRSWNMATLKRLNSPAEVKRHLAGIGYHVVRETRRSIVLEKVA
jgi:hypothetical protein